MSFCMWYEIIGIAASILVLLAMTVKSTTTKGNIIMRAVNLIGSVAFIVYGFCISAWSTAFMNIAAVAVNGVFLYRLMTELKKTE